MGEGRETGEGGGPESGFKEVLLSVLWCQSQHAGSSEMRLFILNVISASARPSEKMAVSVTDMPEVARLTITVLLQKKWRTGAERG